MLALFGHTWASQFGTTPEGIAADTWGSALAGITPEQLAGGLRACVAEGREFPPSAGRFRAMCLGIPTLAAVKAELLTPAAPRSGFVLLVWRYVDAHAIRLADQRHADRMLADAYEVARDQVMRGASVPEAQAAITAEDPPPRKAPTPEVAAAALAEARDLLGPAVEKLVIQPPPTVAACKKAEIEARLREHYASLGKPMNPHDADPRAHAFAESDDDQEQQP
jgi:hypothetical protein